MTNNLKIEQWSNEQFHDARNEWTDLLKRSGSDPLFMSWEWLHTWWEVFSDTSTMELYILAVRDSHGQLVGIAPLYLTSVISKIIIRSNRLQFLGNCWRGKATMPTELMEFIVDPNESKQVISYLYKKIASMKNWNELVLTNLKSSSETSKLLTKEKCLGNCYYRIAETNRSYYVKNKNSFPEYLSKLSKSIRLKLFNRRKLLATIGETTFIPKNDRSIDENLSLLNTFHESRWEKPAFKNDTMEFNLKIARLFKEQDCLIFSEIRVNNTPVSLQYNYLVANHMYNIQSGFDEYFHKKIALGYLHFGYEIEQMYANDYYCYDMLAGDGKNTSYKEHLNTEVLEIKDIQAIRNPANKVLYWLYDTLKKSNKD